MAYINEFPNWDSNKLNLDWILEQYSTFNQRIQEIEDHFDEVAEAMGQEVEQLESDFNDFKTLINNNMDAFELSIQRQLNQGLSNIQSQINTISSDMATYISEHMSEWQAEADYSDHVMKLSNEASPTEDLTKSIYQMQLDGILHRMQLKPPTYLNSAYITGISNGQLQGANDILLEGKGTYLVLMVVNLDMENSASQNDEFNVVLSANNASGTSGLIPIHAKNSLLTNDGNVYLNGFGIYVNTTDENKSVSPRIIHSSSQTQDSSTGAYYGIAIRMCDEWSPVIS